MNLVKLLCKRSVLLKLLRITGLTNSKKKPTKKPSKAHQNNNSNNNNMKVKESPLPGKKGVAVILKGDKAKTNIPKLKSLNTYWHYGWNVECGHDDPTVESKFVPQVWGGAKNDEMMWERLEQKILPEIEAGNCDLVLAFNEPDKKEQSNMTVERCIHYWPLLEKLGVPLCSPSCANPLGCNQNEECNQGVHGHWMKEFMHEIEEKGYRCDYLGVHWYGGANFDCFKKRMREIYDAYGGKYPLMITEFAVADWTVMKKSCEDNKFSQQQVLDFMKKALPWLEQQDWIVGYAWFPFNIDTPQGTCSALFTKQGKLTALGRYYSSVTTENPRGNQDEKIWDGCK